MSKSAICLALVAEECRRLRRHFSFTLEQMAEKFGYAISTIGKFEQGQSFNVLILLKYMEFAEEKDVLEEFLKRIGGINSGYYNSKNNKRNS